MKEKKYKLPNDNRPCMASEPTPSYHGNTALKLPKENVHSNAFEDGDVDWDRIPVGFYPANEEEAIARIEAIEEEFERTGISYSSEEVEAEIKAKFPWLA